MLLTFEFVISLHFPQKTQTFGTSRDTNFCICQYKEKNILMPKGLPKGINLGTISAGWPTV